jgi:hypothetical protein
MALSILDGNQSATTLSTILSSGQHITAHTVVSLGTQAITDIVNATSAGLTNTQLRASAVTVSGTVTIGNSVTISSLPSISGTVTANLANVVTTDSFWGTQAIKVTGGDGYGINIAGIDSNSTPAIIQEGGGIPVYPRDNSSLNAPFPISGTVTIGSALPAGTNRIGVVTIGGGTVTIGAGTAQIGSVTASISGTVPISISSVTVGNSVTIGSLPAISGTVTANLGTAVVQIVSAIEDGDGATFGLDRDFPVTGSVAIQAGSSHIGTVTANLSISSTAITSGSFSSLTSATLVPGNVARKMATVYNLGAGQLFVNAGATATTLGGGFMVALSSGDFYECDYTTTTLSAIFATAGTASWVSH